MSELRHGAMGVATLRVPEAPRVSMNPFAHALRQRLPAMEKLLLLLLGDRADDWGGSIYFALATLEERAGMSRSTLQRTFRELIKLGLVELQVPATPTTPAFYRMVGVPSPLEAKPDDEGCPHVLRRAVLYYFAPICSWCLTPGTVDVGGDGKAWAVTRIDPLKYAGRFTPDNVTLSCTFCARKKKRDGSTTVRSLTDVVAVRGCQLDTPPTQETGLLSDASPMSAGHPPGVTVTPDPSLDPDLDPYKKKQGLRPDRIVDAVENPNDNVGVITKLAHEAYDVLGVNADPVDLSEALKSRCATLRIAYRSDVVLKALDSAKWQREHRSPEVH